MLKEVMHIRNCAICSFPCQNVFVNKTIDLPRNCLTAYTEEFTFSCHLKIDCPWLVGIGGIVRLLCSRMSNVLFLYMSKASVRTPSQLLEDVLECTLLFPYMPFCNILMHSPEVKRKCSSCLMTASTFSASGKLALLLIRVLFFWHVQHKSVAGCRIKMNRHS